MKITAFALLAHLVASQKHYNILCLDGGGIRGLIPA
jgi:patatin-like phospholipase/acyl hydrolase